MNKIQILKDQKIISSREFRKNLSKIIEKPDALFYHVTKNGKSVGLFIPEKNWDEFNKKYSHLL
ncbi:type II toxin-antitoxin system Phd/YefM family antitoxin [Patescibacteria group bacterium]|nr:type II toxin-antitoxin system Phd/YefM family antitoxin [Patescibacteria group bacterium]